VLTETDHSSTTKEEKCYQI